MNAIVAVDRNWAIGNKGSLLVSIPNDMKMFRQTTTGKVVVLGRKTLETFPQKQPLKNRTNIILSRDRGFTAGDAVVVHSIEELLEELKKYPSEDIYIIGGDSIYKQIMEQGTLALKPIIPYTTRPLRDGEEDGREYHFCSEEMVQELGGKGVIVELRAYDTVYGVWT